MHDTPPSSMLRLFGAHRTTLITIYSAVDISDRIFVAVYDIGAADTRWSDTHHRRRSTCTNRSTLKSQKDYRNRTDRMQSFDDWFSINVTSSLQIIIFHLI